MMRKFIVVKSKIIPHHEITCSSHRNSILQKCKVRLVIINQPLWLDPFVNPAHSVSLVHGATLFKKIIPHNGETEENNLYSYIKVSNIKKSRISNILKGWVVINSPSKERELTGGLIMVMTATPSAATSMVALPFDFICYQYQQIRVLKSVLRKSCYYIEQWHRKCYCMHYK